MTVLVDHVIDLDFVTPTATPRIYVKQGDVQCRRVTLNLYANGEAWIVPANVNLMIRYRIHDPDTQEDVQGVYDTMPSGESACTCHENTVTFMPVPQMLSKHGVVSTELVLIQDQRILSTCCFEFYVNRAAVPELEPQVHNYYVVASLEEINDTFREMEYRIYDLEQTVAQLENLIAG